jgi:glycosyltransferase EpsD
MAGKVLFVSHTTNFIKFNLPYMQWFRNQGWEVHYASAEEEPFPVDSCEKHFKICFNRSPYSFDNIKAYKQLKELIEREKYQIIHCHTPMGGVVTRLAARQARKSGTKVIYTAHGFHFYKGAPKINWLLYYPVEKYLSKYTDCLITINQEDYTAAKNKNFKAAKIEKIDGVGISLEKFSPNKQGELLRKELEIEHNDYILVCVGELNKNKNQCFVIQQISALAQVIPSIKLLIVGAGDCRENYEKMCENIKNRVLFLGYRNDVDKIYAISNLLVSASHREGLPVNILEGMAVGLPIVCTRVRGQVDVIKDGINGYLYDVNNSEQFQSYIFKLYNDAETAMNMSKQNIMDVQKYALEKAIANMSDIYKEYM